MNRLRTIVFAAVAPLVVGCGETQAPPASAPTVTVRPPVPPKRYVQPLALCATVSRGIHTSPIGGVEGGGDETTIHLVLHIRNTSDKTISFTKAEGSFVTIEGKGLSMNVVRSDDVDITQIEPGKEFHWDFDTNGHTSQLLDGAEGKPLFFRILLIKGKDAPQHGPFIARLPALDKLPHEGQELIDNSDGKKTETVSLQFKGMTGELPTFKPKQRETSAAAETEESTLKNWKVLPGQWVQ